MNPFPTATDLNRERDAHDRDCDDLWTLQQLRRIVAGARDCASIHDRIKHPDRRWTTDDLLEVLSEQLANIDATAAMIRDSAPVMEDA